jgi:hypothetical protein
VYRVLFRRMRARVFMKKCCDMNSDVKKVCHPAEVEVCGDSEGGTSHCKVVTSKRGNIDI